MLSRLILIFLDYDQILITVKNFKIIQNLLFLHLISIGRVILNKIGANKQLM